MESTRREGFFSLRATAHFLNSITAKGKEIFLKHSVEPFSLRFASTNETFFTCIR